MHKCNFNCDSNKCDKHYLYKCNNRATNKKKELNDDKCWNRAVFIYFSYVLGSHCEARRGGVHSCWHSIQLFLINWA